ncbi:unnamed protein product [Effrenium voratum]|nr:unnamed protein product [Effrenium voratum]
MHRATLAARWAPLGCLRRVSTGEEYLDVLSRAESRRVQSAKQRMELQWQGEQSLVAEGNHHFNRGMKFLEGPNALGVHLTYMGRVKYCRGARGTWGLSRRSVGRLRYALQVVTDP